MCKTTVQAVSTTFLCTAPSGVQLVRRVANEVPEGPLVAALLPVEGFAGWEIWAIHTSEETMPDKVKRAVEAGATVVFVPCERRVER